MQGSAKMQCERLSQASLEAWSCFGALTGTIQQELDLALQLTEGELGGCQLILEHAVLRLLEEGGETGNERGIGGSDGVTCHGGNNPP